MSRHKGMGWMGKGMVGSQRKGGVMWRIGGGGGQAVDGQGVVEGGLPYWQFWRQLMRNFSLGRVAPNCQK